MAESSSVDIHHPDAALLKALLLRQLAYSTASAWKLYVRLKLSGVVVQLDDVNRAIDQLVVRNLVGPEENDDPPAFHSTPIGYRAATSGKRAADVAAILGPD